MRLRNWLQEWSQKYDRARARAEWFVGPGESVRFAAFWYPGYPTIMVAGAPVPGARRGGIIFGTERRLVLVRGEDPSPHLHEFPPDTAIQPADGNFRPTNIGGWATIGDSERVFIASDDWRKIPITAAWRIDPSKRHQLRYWNGHSAGPNMWQTKLRCPRRRSTTTPW